MTTYKDQLCRREFLTRAAQATAVAAVSASMGSAPAPLLARADAAAPPRASRIS